MPSDALVAVREGDCDVGLIDDALWEPLMRFPEWKKFSSTLAAEGMRAERAWLVSAAAPADRAWLAAEMRAWDRAGAWKALAAKWARDPSTCTWTRKCRTATARSAPRGRCNARL